MANGKKIALFTFPWHRSLIFGIAIVLLSFDQLAIVDRGPIVKKISPLFQFQNPPITYYFQQTSNQFDYSWLHHFMRLPFCRHWKYFWENFWKCWMSALWIYGFCSSIGWNLEFDPCKRWPVSSNISSTWNQEENELITGNWIMWFLIKSRVISPAWISFSTKKLTPIFFSNMKLWPMIQVLAAKVFFRGAHGI